MRVTEYLTLVLHNIHRKPRAFIASSFGATLSFYTNFYTAIRRHKAWSCWPNVYTAVRRQKAILRSNKPQFLHLYGQKCNLERNYKLSSNRTDHGEMSLRIAEYREHSLFTHVNDTSFTFCLLRVPVAAPVDGTRGVIYPSELLFAPRYIYVLISP